MLDEEYEKILNWYANRLLHAKIVPLKANAVVIILCRNTDLLGISKALRNFEQKFNAKFGYPYVFLNDVPFTDVFKSGIEQLNLVGSSQFGHIPTEHWSYPSWIDREKARLSRVNLQKKKVIYGGLESYRHMCRFNSGFFYRQDLILTYDYYWRIEPDVEFLCDIDYDPFLYMQEHKKIYGFTITLGEIHATIPSLWNTTRDFIRKNPSLVDAKRNMLKFFMNPNGSYNLCHFWSNFEIADLRFYRSEAYSRYFDYLDRSGGFFYERWGDAPVHSLAVGMFLDRSQVHFFNDIGYRHPPFMHCPISSIKASGDVCAAYKQSSGANVQRCKCKASDSFDWSSGSCLRRFLSL